MIAEGGEEGEPIRRQDRKRGLFQAVLGIRIRRIRMFLDLPDPDPDPLDRGTDPDPDPLVRGTDLDPDPSHFS